MGRQSLVEFVREYAGKGDEIAFRHRVGYRMRSWTYAQTAAEANRVARELERRGIGKGDAALLWAENSPEWVAVFFGCVLRGAGVAREVAAKVMLRSGGVAESATPVPVIALDALLEITKQCDSSPYDGPALTRQDTLQIIFTSGTTAEPRGVVISHGNVLANIEPIEKEIHKYLRYEKPFHPLRFLNLLPLSHVFGQMLGLFIPPLLKGTVILAA